ncbi:MAG: aminotransferase class I/II-fold pyridoxal phosphate-dependent enzyme [Tissierellales bacterium]|jgi:aspartate/methionine/tyrosine aminotransferase|nr:aminotransferase class I/II-fold pyridoxal phosphate-dependent enzyme [Tissierellales bacterium]
MKTKLIAKRYKEAKPTLMGAVDQLAKKFNHTIDLSLGDPDITTDSSIIDFASNEAKKGHTQYTDFRGDPELLYSISKFYEDEYSINISTDEMMITVGACLGMYLTLETIINPGEEVLLFAPYYTPYKQQVELAGGVPIEICAYVNNNFALDSDDLEQYITTDTKAIIINSPNNPTGAILDLDELNMIADIAIKYDLAIISDEIYDAYDFNKSFHSMVEIEKIRDRLIVINSFSKNYAMTGWRIGNIIAPPELIDICLLVNENVAFTAPSISQRAGIYALNNRNKIQTSLINTYKKRIDYAISRIESIPWMKLHNHDGTFYLFIDISSTNFTSEQVSTMLLERAQVLTIPGNAFGKCGEGFIRIACTKDISQLKIAFDRISSIII